TKRYLHLGQSIFLPISCGSRTGTMASQLGHICLKLFGTVAILAPAFARCRTGRGVRTGQTERFIHHSESASPYAKGKTRIATVLLAPNRYDRGAPVHLRASPRSPRLLSFLPAIFAPL